MAVQSVGWKVEMTAVKLAGSMVVQMVENSAALKVA